VVELKREEFIQNWIREKQKSTYVRIKQGWGECEFMYPGWVK
jgi:peptidyl-prolyl cis-trans isomerase SurA